MRNIISITKTAANRIKALIAQRNKVTAGIRIGVKQGGCSGLAYTFEYVDEKNPADEEVVDKDVVIFIAPKAVLYLVGTELDYKDERVKSGFVFINPNEKGKCGCGESFYT
ncbi:MAG: iron-sulfur cluster assembly accessory protein [Candidatus Midichloria sp.]|nr:MAG: iron-sulfur cluster assembly accessory protein [Candidatus Midichloria sp.]